MTKICFISFNSYPLFIKNHLGYFGGAEVQISLIAKNLAKDKNFRVSLVVADYGQKSPLKLGPLMLYKGMRNFSFFPIELIRFLLTLKKINADVYVERTLNLKVGLVCLFCKLFKKKFVYMTAHSWDCQLNHGQYLKGLSKFSFNFGLKHADLIITQTKDQKNQLKNSFGLESFIMRSLVTTKANNQTTHRRWLLWVGRADKWKRPEKFVQLAEKLPQSRFIMVCRQGNDQKFYLKIKKRAAKQTNLKFLEAVNHRDISHYFRQAKFYVNTSVAEGFPNTFLQAGQSKTPVVSLSVNPDQIINRFKIGYYCRHSFDELIRLCRLLNQQPNLGRIFGINNYRYVKKFHTLENIQIFKRSLENILTNH